MRSRGRRMAKTMTHDEFDHCIAEAREGYGDRVHAFLLTAAEQHGVPFPAAKHAEIVWMLQFVATKC